MRILLVNPNTTAGMTANIAAAARRVAAPGTEIVALTSPQGPASIEGYYDEAMSLAGLLQAVREALSHMGVHRMTVVDAQGYGRQKGHSANYQGVEYRVNLLRKVSLEICVNDDFLERTIETICAIARTVSST